MPSRYTVCLYFQDLETGAFQTVYPQGMRTDEVMALLADPAKQFAPVPPAPPSGIKIVADDTVPLGMMKFVHPDGRVEFVQCNFP